MALKSKKELRKIWKEKYKKMIGVEFVSTSWSPSIPGKLPKTILKKGTYMIANQKGAFGLHVLQPTFDPDETNHMRHKRLREPKEIRKTILEGAKGLLTRTLGE